MDQCGVGSQQIAVPRAKPILEEYAATIAPAADQQAAEARGFQFRAGINSLVLALVLLCFTAYLLCAAALSPIFEGSALEPFEAPVMVPLFLILLGLVIGPLDLTAPHTKGGPPVVTAMRPFLLGRYFTVLLVSGEFKPNAPQWIALIPVLLVPIVGSLLAAFMPGGSNWPVYLALLMSAIFWSTIFSILELSTYSTQSRAREP